jgi:Fe-S oxidoreductase
MPRSKGGSLCCGAGGGNFWRKSSVGKRIEEVRVEEAALTKSDAIVSACPFCRIMFDSAVKQKGLENQLKVMDIIDVVAQVS